MPAMFSSYGQAALPLRLQCAYALHEQDSRWLAQIDTRPHEYHYQKEHKDEVTGCVLLVRRRKRYRYPQHFAAGPKLAYHSNGGTPIVMATHKRVQLLRSTRDGTKAGTEERMQ